MSVKVLLADDDDIFRYLLRTILRSALDIDIARVLEAEDGQAAVDLMRSEQAEVVVIDVMMPRLDGFQVTRLIKHEWPATKVVLVSSVAEEAYKRAAYDIGADAFLDKSDLIARLVPIIRTLT